MKHYKNIKRKLHSIYLLIIKLIKSIEWLVFYDCIQSKLLFKYCAECHEP